MTYKVYVKFKKQEYEFTNIKDYYIEKNELVLIGEKGKFLINYSKVEYYYVEVQDSIYK